MNEEQNDIEQSADDAEANDAEGQAGRVRFRNDQPEPPKDTGAEAAEPDDDDVEGQAKRFFR